MIVVKIEMHPGGDAAKAREIGRAHIANVGGTETVADYSVTLFKSPEYASGPGIWKRGTLRGFRRLRYGPWELLALALIAANGKRTMEASKGVS